jgi:16S rRNA (cytidine1402-2'-O)-methyltransferase
MKDRKINNSESRNSEFRSGNSGILYIVSTPIGNLEDITLRALRILKSVDLIAAESVKHSRGLCQHYGIKTRLISYNQHNQQAKGPELIRRLRSGSDIALVTNAGTPGVSDPGGLLINQAMEKNINVSPIPGPSAVIAALSVSGLQAERFLFLGFLPNRSSKRRKELKNLISEHRTMVFFEAPHRLQAMLTDLKEILGDRQIVVLREMTKVYEEVKRGPVSAILEQLEPDKIKGEFTLVVAGKEKGEDEHLLDKEIQKKIEKLLKEKNMRIKDIATQLSEENGLTYRRLYRECLSIKRAMGS